MPRGGFSTQLVASGARRPCQMASTPKNTERGNGATALHAAVENGHYAAAELCCSVAPQSDAMEAPPDRRAAVAPAGRTAARIDAATEARSSRPRWVGTLCGRRRWTLLRDAQGGSVRMMLRAKRGLEGTDPPAHARTVRAAGCGASAAGAWGEARPARPT